EAHEAIRPTSVLREPSKIKDFLNDDEFKLYDLIWKKFVASQMTEAVDEHVAVFIAAGEKYIFKTTGRRNLFPGFGIVYDGGTPTARKDETKEETEKEMLLEDMPSLDQGEILKMLEIIGHQHFTKPPGRYNDASLVKTLEENGIGRPSTYAPTIYTLLSRDYVHRKGGALVPNELGETVVDLLLEHFPKVMDVEFTATMENELDRVEEGQMKWVDVIEEFYGPFKQSLDVALEKMKDFRREVVETDYKCEVCGKNLVEKWGRFGKFLACPAFPDCKFTRSMPTGAHCPEPNCKGDLVRRKSKKGRAFYGCSNYPECKYITNKLPKTEEGLGEDDQISDGERETIGP
ncbi:MAG: topoisomerase DNA-binding C4 zinc finger domain-containing protein, partial [Candidatus Omnitrophica bacterium]|nr:topoisomerase DNA-binding C4 zinc finger domain-containing protein [Candidatus Omnitrophota bacterium]